MKQSKGLTRNGLIRFRVAICFEKALRFEPTRGELFTSNKRLKRAGT